MLLTVRLTGIEEIENAAEIVEPVVRRTPVERPVSLSRLAQRPLLLKCEQLQRTGSFKVRGAYNRIARLDPIPAAGVVAASAGNHAQGVALAAQLLGVRATIFMPESASLPKVLATRDYGGEIRLEGATFDDAVQAATAFAEARGAVFVPAFDDSDVIAGQGTVGLELAEQAPEADTFVFPIGGGGLISGAAAALKACRRGCRVIGVEAAGAPSMRRALDAHQPVVLDTMRTIADGIAVRAVSPLTLAHVEAFVDDVVTVSDDEISRAVVLLLERVKAVVEPAGAAALAAVLSGTIEGSSPIGVVLSGGNVDPALLTRLIRHGLTAAGRFLVVHVIIEDRPGGLSALLGLVAKLGLNVLEVDHHRTGIDLGVEQVQVRLALETRDPEHRDDVLAALNDAGYRLLPSG